MACRGANSESLCTHCEPGSATGTSGEDGQHGRACPRGSVCPRLGSGGVHGGVFPLCSASPIPETQAHTRTCAHTHTCMVTRVMVQGGCFTAPGSGRGTGDAARVTELRRGKLTWLDVSLGRRSHPLTVCRSPSLSPAPCLPSFPRGVRSPHGYFGADPGLAGRTASPTSQRAGLWGSSLLAAS